MNAKVSVILPSLNVVRYIRECMNSVISQSMQELEIICVDAGSVDGTKELLNEYAEKDPRITVLNSDVKSYGKQVNIGLEYASGEYIAILETDDWIARDMYQFLYKYASEEYLDYVAADFDIFYELQSGSCYFTRQYLFWGEQREWYGKILDSDQIAALRSDDYVLWKGIYNREFLNVNHIRLHESSGAAFQDMGFLQQVKTYAKRAKYIDESFYRYRQDREGVSSKEIEGLKYYEKEFLWLNDKLKLPAILKGVHKKYYYYTMSISFITKYEQILISLNGNWQDKRLSESYLWFQEQLVKAVRGGILDETMYAVALRERLRLLLTSQEAHAKVVMNTEKKKQDCVQLLKKITRNRPLIIFGCGVRGEKLMLFCNRNHIDMKAFCDNNVAIQGKKKFGFPIISPNDLKSEIYNKNVMVIISMKKGAEQVHGQLVNLGIEAHKIVNEIPEGII